ncbi:MAG: type II toxin-antitoxin system HicB family antitoxin [Pseudomonadota bacterium]
MKFVIAIEPGHQHQAFGVTVPDLPGCFSAGDTLDQAVDNAREAIELWCSTTIADGGRLPVFSSLAEHQKNPDFTGWIWAVVDVPIERYLGPAAKINITLPRHLLAQIDHYTRTHGKSRSGFLAQAAMTMMAQAQHN